ncbi:MAG TPA: STAS domain-containing protein [Acidimicrobiales bacterium]|nr:STAS domain-containing protein [Acidimicrobiales bacterium]
MTVVVPGPDRGSMDPAPGGWHESMTADRVPVGDGLAIWTDQSSSRCVLRLRGRLCFDTVAVLDLHVDRLGCRWCDEVVVDVGSLAHLDRVGARLLVGLRHYVAARGGRFELRQVGEEMRALVQAAEAELGT